MASLMRYFNGPSLIRIYQIHNSPGLDYVENILELYSSKLMSCIKSSFSLCYYFSPLVLLWLYRRDLITSPDGLLYLSKFTGTMMVVYGLCKVIRGIGRMNNEIYCLFNDDLMAFQNKRLDREAIRKYEFGIAEIPPDFSMRGHGASQHCKSVAPPPGYNASASSGPHTGILAYIAASSFGRWMIYPGSTGVLNAMIEPALHEGRRKWIEDRHGRRYKLETANGITLDSLFVDKRHEANDNGNILVIGSEGNAAFYEAGCLEAPYNNGYSVLGWNAPGFGASTGKPYPENVHKGIETVVEFALTELNFTIDQIVFYSWSIGGFASAYAAATHPDCKGLILDATFDNVLPLALNRMPEWLGPTIERSIKTYFNLDVAYWTSKYTGPVRLIRRQNDEMISTDAADPRTNRGNFLLLKLLMSRYPQIINSESKLAIGEWLSQPNDIRRDMYVEDFGISRDDCMATLASLSIDSTPTLPLRAGEELEQTEKNKLALYLAEVHMSHMESTHCVPLPSELFRLPWKIPSIITS